MSNIIEYAKQELDSIGMFESEDKMNTHMRNHILHMCEEFSKERHSGFSASYALGCLDKLLRFEPLSPLTGDDSEWNDVSAYSDGSPRLQNKRCSRVFKDDDGKCWDIEGIVWYEWHRDTPQSENYKSYFTNKESSVYIEFPYTPTTEYKEWVQQDNTL